MSLEAFQQYNAQVKSTIHDFLEQKRHEPGETNFWRDDVIDRLQEFVIRGKLLRSNLLLYAARMFEKEIDPSTFKIAAAIEFFHSSMLIHDDIIDQDDLRRGLPTIHNQYARSFDFASNHAPQSLAICVGDIGFFLGYQLISESGASSKFIAQITSFWSREFIHVGLAEMDDSYLGHLTAIDNDMRIREVYRYKTARYTFSVPLMTGALLAETSQQTIRQLEKIGEGLGLIFQMKDDELGIFGDPNVTGKSVGSDIAAAKKTLYHYHLFNQSSEDGLKHLHEIFGKAHLSLAEVEYVQKAIQDQGIDKLIKEQMMSIANDIRVEIASLDVEQAYREALFNLLDYNLTRQK